MIYVFEGIEGAGKTSSARRFARRSGLEVYDDPSRHAPAAAERTPEDWMRLGGQANLDVASFARITDFAVDRWCLTAMTYDYLRGAYAGDDFYRPLARNVRARVYLLDVDPELAFARATRVKERALTLDLLVARRERYLESAELWRSWGGEVLVVDSSGDTDDVIGTADAGPGDDFAALLSRQRAFNAEFFGSLGLNLGELSREERERWTREFVLHVEDELHEFLRETHWKMHRRRDDRAEVSRRNLLEEWTDVFKFVLGLANVWDLNAVELVEEFYRKSAIVEAKFRSR